MKNTTRGFVNWYKLVKLSHIYDVDKNNMNINKSMMKTKPPFHTQDYRRHETTTTLKSVKTWYILSLYCRLTNSNILIPISQSCVWSCELGWKFHNFDVWLYANITLTTQIITTQHYRPPIEREWKTNLVSILAARLPYLLRLFFIPAFSQLLSLLIIQRTLCIVRIVVSHFQR